MSETMKAAIFVEPGKMTVEEVPKAALQQDDDIVIRMVRTCVCGSDLWFFRGLSGQAAHSQVGHESIGVVEEVGAEVESVKPGDFVVVPFPYSCGKCPVCKAGFESVCPHGGYFSACQADCTIAHDHGCIAGLDLGRNRRVITGGHHIRNGQGARFTGRLFR